MFIVTEYAALKSKWAVFILANRRGTNSQVHVIRSKGLFSISLKCPLFWRSNVRLFPLICPLNPLKRTIRQTNPWHIQLTHLSRMEFPTVINRNSPFLFVWVGIFHFYSNFNRTFYKQTVETLIRRCVMWRLVWVCIICLRPAKTTLCLYGLSL